MLLGLVPDIGGFKKFKQFLHRPIPAGTRKIFPLITITLTVQPLLVVYHFPVAVHSLYECA